MMEELVRETRFTTFDGTVTLPARHQRPDRYSHLEAPDSRAPRIPRGGGYSYSASGFGKNSLVQEMTCFNRFLEFNPTELTLKVESGTRLIDLMEWAIPRQLHLPVLPGYPLITVGGCVAADVHGKNPLKDGTFSDWVKQLTLFHPQNGYQTCSLDENPQLFAMSCGGFGLTGIITDVTLQLSRLPAPAVSLSREGVEHLHAAHHALATCNADIAYSWHDARPGKAFGRGIVYTGHWTRNAAPPQPLRFKPMTAASRASLPMSAWNGVTARIANKAILLHSHYSKGLSVTGILDASFPFASNVYFHKLFGRPGLRESQFLVPDDNVSRCFEALGRLVNDTKAPTMMLSLKKFKGRQRALSMSGSGCLIAIDCYRNASTESFMAQLDELILEVNGQPNLSKDSRLPGEIARQSLPAYETFKRQLLAYDANRIMQSELSDRLGLP